LIITAGGENVAPILIEDAIKELCPVISNIMCIGEGQRFMGAIITFKADIDPATGIPSKNLTPEAKQKFKQELNLELKTTDEAIANEKV
jgi:long-chain-fatty-acid--CoA ligase ACSBG